MTINKRAKFYIVPAVVLFAAYSVIWALPVPHPVTNYSYSKPPAGEDSPLLPPDTGLRVPVPQPDNNPLDENDHTSPFNLQNPPTLGTNIEYDPETNTYNLQNMTGSVPYGPSSSLSVDEFIDYDLRKSINDYWRDKGAGYSTSTNRRGGGLIPQLKVGSDVFESIFGSNVIDIRPSGNAELIFGVMHNRRDDPGIPVKQRKTTQFNFDQKIQLNVLAKIGDKIEFNLNYNTQANFDFENKMKLKFEGKEDDIIQLLEFGDVNLPLNSTLIQGSQSLFGLKTQLKFGKLTITSVLSQQNAESKTITVAGGAQTNDFYFKADEYEENKHFFIDQFFRDNYGNYLSTLPLVSSPVNITKIEVWRTTIGAATQENRNVVAFTDLGEANPQFSGFQNIGGYGYPYDSINNLPYVIDTSLIRNISTVSDNLRNLGLKSGVDFEKVESARLLSPSEYTYNSKLGFISLNTALTADQVLSVSFQYTVIGDNKVYQVGEFSNEVIAPNCIRTKLLKSTTLNTKSPLWKLMMKNVYSLRAYQVNSKDFRLNVLYTGDEEGIPNGFFNEGAQKGIPLIRLMGLDRLNHQQDPYPDGIFDFIDNASTLGGTINSSNGKIYFPTVEPFGKDLRAVLTDPAIADKYAFDSLYTLTKQMAQQYPGKNKYYLEGTYKSASGAEIALNAMNIPQGSVKVTAGGIPLVENIQYTVNYSMGRVTILDEGILNSGTPINISLENQSGMSFNKRSMFGARLDYKFSKDFTLGATILNLRERPITNKVNYGDEPINNTIWGMNVAYKTEARFITKMIDYLPFHSTTKESFVQFDGEFAHFIPGHSRAISKAGVTYIDDFEATKSTVDLRTAGSWVMASTPQYQYDLFPEARPSTSADSDRKKLSYGFNRARLAWYVIDPIFYRNNSATPSNITAEDQSKPYAREVYETELFPYRQRQSTAESTNIAVFNMSFYPTEKGPYNFDVTASENLNSAGINADGSLKSPETRWGGMMRKMDNTDFEAANFEYIEFWMMDPFIEEPAHKGGKLYFNLGDISEDILRDGKKFFENGLPADESDNDVEFTVWGRVPTIQMIVNAFENDPAARPFQDVGYDGLSNERERQYFNTNYLSLVQNELGAIPQIIYDDPSSDDYHYFRGSDYDAADMKIVERYKKFNGSEGNSPTDNQSPESYPTMGSNLPNVEDVNRDNTLSEEEKYYQYTIDLRPDKMNVGQNYINDIYDAVSDRLPNGSTVTTRWYQFKIPIKNPDKVIGDIQGFNSIRFMRVFMREFDQPVFIRLATFELVRSDWRSYTLSLLDPGERVPGQGSMETVFNVSSLSYEENGNRVPIPYVIPPGIDREQGVGGMQTYYVNEQSLTMSVKDLNDGDSRAIYKNTQYDMRRFKKLKMFVHAEKLQNTDILEMGDVNVFIRLGSDFTENYYQYEIPVQITPWGVGADSTLIWPEANRMEIDLEQLVQIKQQRNIDVRTGEFTNSQIYDTIIDGHKISVVGMPNLADVRTIMIGIHNPKKESRDDGDDMLPKSVEVWVNELRLTNFDDKSGFAALGRMRMNLADIGDVTLSGTYSTPGFGSLEQRITERQQETKYSIDFATNLDAGKVLFPEKWNIVVPVHYDISQNVATPEYNPLNPDVKLKDDLATYETKAERDSIRRMTQDFVQRQNVNLMNVRKERDIEKNKKIRPWDVENLDFSYAYSEIRIRNVDTEFDNKFSHRGGIGYTFNHNPKNYRPLSAKKALKSKWLQLFRDFNFYLMPKVFTFRTEIYREMNQFKLRPKSKGNIIIDTNYVKIFDWSRNYNLRWDITQNLNFEYSAVAQARIDEPQGLIDTRAKKDSVWRSFGDGGRMNRFDQNFAASWQVPLNKIPVFNWVTLNLRYSSTYNYTASPLSLQYLGNTIGNSNTKQVNASANLVTLYNNVPYLKKVNQGIVNKQQSKKPPAKKDTDPKAKPDEKKADGKDNKDNKEKDKNKSKRDSLNKLDVGQLILDGTVRVLMLVRNATFSYTEGNGSTLPGYMYQPDLFGINFKTNSPGFLYVFGGYPDSRIRDMAAAGGWLTTDTLLNTPFQTRYNQVINYGATVEPFKDFRISVTGNKNRTSNYNEYFRADAEGVFHSYSPQTSGTFSMTYIGLKTMFRNGNEVFAEFKSIRREIAGRVAAENPNSHGVDPNTGFPDGYSNISQDVLIPAFIAAYTGRNPSSVNVNSPFPKIPLPNWRLRYDGLTKMKKLGKFFQTFSISHSYTSTYTVGNYLSTIPDPLDGNGDQSARNSLNNFAPIYDIGQITIMDQLSPLIGFDMVLKNSVTIKVEFKKTRNVSLSFANNQITEINTNELVVNAGYRFKDLKIGFMFSGMKRQVVSDLNLTAGFTLRDNRTVLRKIVEDVNQVSAGMMVVTINIAADYQISKMVGLRFFYDHTMNRPYISNQYNNTSINTGISVRLMLTQ